MVAKVVHCVITMPRKGNRRASSVAILHQGNSSHLKKKGHKSLTSDEIDFLTERTQFSEKCNLLALPMAPWIIWGTAMVQCDSVFTFV